MKRQRDKVSILEMKILIHDPRTAVFLKMSSASGKRPLGSILISDLQPVCSSKSLEELFLIGRYGPKVQDPETALQNGQRGQPGTAPSNEVQGPS